MKETTLTRKQRARLLQEPGGAWLVHQVIQSGKQALDEVTREMGKIIVEGIFLMEREEIAGPDYHPKNSAIHKWSGQGGSVFLGDHKQRVWVPRLRGPGGEIHLNSYQRLKDGSDFSQGLLNQWLTGMSGRRYEWIVEDAEKRLGVSASSVSRHLKGATAQRLREFRERDLSGIDPFAVFIDTVHRGGMAFIVALGIDVAGAKHVLGFWEGATENHEICLELLSNIAERGFRLSRDVLYITDGCKGVIKALKMRFGKYLLHQRCTVHKQRNILSHLPKKYRPEASRRFRRAMDMVNYQDAQRELTMLKVWLEEINISAAESLEEGLEELLTLHRLHIPPQLRRSLRSTNAIESLFSGVRFYEKNIKRYRSSSMSHRWLGTVLLHSERGFRKIKGYQSIRRAQESIDSWQNAVEIESCAA